MLDHVERQEFAAEDGVTEPAHEYNPSDYSTTRLWIVDRKRAFYRDTKWLHEGGNLLGVFGVNAHKIKAFIDVHEQQFHRVTVMQLTRALSRPELFVAFPNKHHTQHPDRSVDAAFDMLCAHFQDEWFESDGFVFEHLDRYRR